MSQAELIIAALRHRGATVATGESLTGGLVCAALVDVPGASLVVRGGIVAYQASIKTELLDVPAALLAARGTVDPQVAVALARGARERLDATFGLATTGVAGPGPSGGKPPGTVHVAVAGPDGAAETVSVRLDGDRDAVRHGAVVVALSALDATLRREETGSAPR